MGALYGALLGDIVGSTYEYEQHENVSEDSIKFINEESHITDDSLLTLAVADAIMENKDVTETIKQWSRDYEAEEHQMGFGGNFQKYIHTPEGSVNDSWGNGCIMRVSPYLWLGDLEGALRSCNGSHAHRRSYKSVVDLYDMYFSDFVMSDKTPDDFNKFDVSADGTIDFVRLCMSRCMTIEEVILLAVQVGGDTDTNASIAAETMNFWKMGTLPRLHKEYIESKLDKRQLEVLLKFNKLV